MEEKSARAHPRIMVSRLDVGPRRGEGWMPDDRSDRCLVCMAAFTFINRRHHCRQCLKLVCSACSSKKWQLDSGRGGRGPVSFRRVCDECYAALANAHERHGRVSIQVLVGGEPSTLEPGEYMHFEVVVHKIVPIDPFLAQPGTVADRCNYEKAWPHASVFIRPGSVPSGLEGFPPSSSSTSGAAPEASPRLSGSEFSNRARAWLCKLTVAGKEIGRTQLAKPTPYSIPGEVVTGRHNFEQAFMFRVSCRTRVADYLILEVLDKSRVESHCRVPLFRTRRDRVRTFWHMLFKGNGAPGAVGRVLVTVRNLGAGSIARPAWGHSIPGGCPVSAPPEITPQAPSSKWRGTGERKDCRGGGVSQGSEDRVVPAAGEDLPDNPLLLEFFPRNNKMHDALFFRFGENDENVLPFNERTLEILPRVCLRPIQGQMDGNAGDSTRVRRWSPCGGEEVEDDEDSRMDGAKISPRSPSEEAVMAEAGSLGDMESCASSSCATLFNSSFSPNSRDDPTRRPGKGAGRSFRAGASSTVMDGALVLTTHRLLFFEDAGGGKAGMLVQIPLAFVLETAVRRELTMGQVGLKIRCRDKKVYPFVVMRGASRTVETVLLQSVKKVEEEISWLAQEDNFAHSVDTCRADTSLDPEGKSLELNLDVSSILDAPPSPFSRCTREFPSEYHPAQEHRRQGIDESDQWRFSGVNRSFSLCQTYGRFLVVPSALGEQDIRKASKGRSRRRIPALTWLHPLTGAGLCRSSEPIAGFMLNPSSLYDEKLLNAIRETADSPPDDPVYSGTMSTSGSKNSSSVVTDACADPGKASYGDHAEPSPTHEVLERSRTGLGNSDEGPIENSTRSCDDQGVARAEARQESGALQGNPIIVKAKRTIEGGGSHQNAGEAENVIEGNEVRGKPRPGGSRDEGRGNDGSSADTKNRQGILFLKYSSSSDRGKSGTQHPPMEATVASAEDTAESDSILKDFVSSQVSVEQSDLNPFSSDVTSPHPVPTDGAESRSPESCLGSMPTTSAEVTSAVDEDRRIATANMVMGETRVEDPRNLVGGLVSPVTETTLPVSPPVMDDVVRDVGDYREDETENLWSPVMTSISFLPEVLTPQSNSVFTTQRTSGAGVENAAATGTTPSQPSSVSRMQTHYRRVDSDVAEAAARPAWHRSHSAPNLMEPRPSGDTPSTRRTAVLRIMDARSVLSAKARRLLGKGHENIARLGGSEHASIAFLDIPNAHKVQRNFNALVEACRTQEDNPARLAHMHGLRWVENISALLKGASRVCKYLEAGDPVLVHCSDGWDRTPQLTSLAQLLLDPYYRTFEGFQVLVKKDWCSFGHRFATRGGYGQNTNSRTSPIFLQFLDATYQLLRQFPKSFEFSENLLLLFVHAFCSRWFDDFLHDSEYERVLAYARSSLAVAGGGSTVSLWLHVHHCRERYENVLWERPPGSFEGGRDSIGAGISTTEQARDDFGYGSAVQSADAEMHSPRAELDLPSSLRPKCGVQSLVVWERAWGGKGLQHPACGRPRNPSYNTEGTLCELVQHLWSTIRDLRRNVEACGCGGLDRGIIQC